MQPIALDELQQFQYNSSVNPTYIPGRYNNLHEPRTLHKKEDGWQLPASVSPLFRIPLFWISFHNFPMWFYKYLFKSTIKKDGYVNTYFHPWEFTNLDKYPFPFYLKRNMDTKMLVRFDRFLRWCKARKYKFVRTTEIIPKD